MDKIQAVILGVFVILVLTGLIGSSSSPTSIEQEITFMSFEEYHQMQHSEAMGNVQSVQPLGFNS
ncbi:hypothetical protein DRN74_01805 [Candidatus Micrarchaeota archaeon]|nr:MAG: hypothetical protein DRN74_01805 [Candidatus Micrarchaeota archaeon]